jgi:hypothetical protein
MKYAEPRPLADPEKAARKLVDIANAVEAVQDGRIFIELINRPFLDQDGTPDQYRAALARALAQALIDHPERTLNAAEIDAVIAQTLAREALAAEQARRAVWRRTLESATSAPPIGEVNLRYSSQTGRPVRGRMSQIDARS